MNIIDFTINGHRYTNDPVLAASAGIPPEFQFIGYSAINALGNLASDVSAVGAGAAQAEIAAAASAFAAQGLQVTSTSTTALAPANGAQVFVTQAGRQYQNNVPVFAVSASDSTKWISGTIGAYDGTSLTINGTSFNGAGAVSDWNITVAGVRGAPGALASNTAFTPEPVAALNVDCTLGKNYFTKTITAGSNALTITPPASAGFSFTLQLKVTGGTFTVPANARASNNLLPVMQTGKTHYLVFVTSNFGVDWAFSILPNYTM